MLDQRSSGITTSVYDVSLADVNSLCSRSPEYYE